MKTLCAKYFKIITAKAQDIATATADKYIKLRSDTIVFAKKNNDSNRRNIFLKNNKIDAVNRFDIFFAVGLQK